MRIRKTHLIAAAIASGMTEREICALSKVAHQTFKKMKKGNMIQFPCIGRICETLDIQPAEILDDVDEDLPEKRLQEPLNPAAVKVAIKRKLSLKG